MGEVKQMNIKNRYYFKHCYFYNDKINVKDFESNLLKIDKKLYKNIDIYNIGYITIKTFGDCEIFKVQILFTYLLIMQSGILKKRMEINT